MKTVNVTIVSDLMCPWCYVGLRKLQQGSKIANVQPKITWKPYMLRQGIPEEGLPKGGSPASRVPQRLQQSGESVGINFTGLTDRTPNTELFHATMAAIHDEHDADKQTEFQEEVFDLYFTKGVFPDKVALEQAAEKVGVADTVHNLYSDKELLLQMRSKVRREAKQASMSGISGVPFFFFNDEPAFSGAVDVGTFVKYLDSAPAAELTNS